MSTRRSSSPGGTPATRALGTAGVPFTTHQFEHDATVGSFGMEAVAALGVAAERVFKTLVAQTDRSTEKGLVVAMLPVDRQLDLKALAREFGCKRAVLADSSLVERTTGYLVGGISPVGQKRPLPAVLDRSATVHRTILVSGGRRGFEIELAPGDLATLIDARLADVAR